MSFVVFTGAKRVRGTWIARAPGIEPIAAPMADSSWMTGGLSGGRGSTVLWLAISGRARARQGGGRRGGGLQLLQPPQVDPDVVGVVPAPAFDVGERGVALGHLRRFPQ